MSGTPPPGDENDELIPFPSDPEPDSPEPAAEPDTGRSEAAAGRDSGRSEAAAEPGGRASRAPKAAQEPLPGAGASGDQRPPDADEADAVPLPARRERAFRKAGLLTLGAAASLVALGVGAFVVLRPYVSPADFDGAGTGAVTVRISPGSSAEQIGTALAEAGVVASARSFVNATEQRAVADRLRPGHYRLRKGMAAAAALELLLAPASKVVRRVSVPEGLRAGEVLQRIAQQAGLPLKQLQAVDKARVGLPQYAPGLEGFLFPATYEIEPGAGAADAVAMMVARFHAAAKAVRLEQEAARVHLSPLEAVTVASLVQAEGGVDADYPKIARVIYNRLAKGMPLQIDSTVLYAQGRRELKKVVTESDTKVDSPYNTYQHKGLPPGPIGNPGEKALLAALHPAKGDWHWFVTTDPAHRITKFTNKESEFVRYREELNRNLGMN
ncbi:endolytic transglycosylase MltG [Nonomuraea sp. NN258]|uniref:endolytic transglycosylase MltG n=1 Tax=Nonomuraea antri TaxID=2730852 RepID=UPI00156A6F8A|nr:endolytic transglycosylase MltG [Nonomuraea antri]NRQ32068.1 endolytic transglycosylase MltG [Nonomuraea antri]